MPIVNIKSPEVFGPIDAITGRHGAPDYRQARGVVQSAEGSVAIGASDLAGSTYEMIQLPSNAILMPDTILELVNFAHALVQVGIDSNHDALVASVSTVSLADQSPIVLWGAKWNLPLWSQVGLAADPGGLISIKAYDQANATGAGAIKFRFAWKGN